MLKMSGWILTVGLVMVGTRAARGQMDFPGGPMGPTGQMPPEMAEMQKAQERLTKEVAPEFHAFQQKLRRVEAKIGKITESLVKSRARLTRTRPGRRSCRWSRRSRISSPIRTFWSSKSWRGRCSPRRSSSGRCKSLWGR